MPNLPVGSRGMTALEWYDAAESLTLREALDLMKALADELRAADLKIARLEGLVKPKQCQLGRVIK
jgi:hypothetical protein